MCRPLAVALLVSIVGLTLGANNASAVSFHSQTTPEYLSGQQLEPTTFRFPSTHFGEFFLEPICAEGKAGGETTASAPEQIQLLPTYSSCTTQALPVTVETNGCGYAVTPFASEGGFGANLKLTCPTGKQIVFVFFNGICRIMIGPQTPSESSFELVNEGSPTDVRFAGTGRGFSYATNPSSGTNCGVASNNAELVLNLAIKGYSDEARTKQVGFTVE
jgi:hypothetical protein